MLGSGGEQKDVVDAVEAVGMWSGSANVSCPYVHSRGGAQHSGGRLRVKRLFCEVCSQHRTNRNYRRGEENLRFKPLTTLRSSTFVIRRHRCHLNDH